MISHATYIVSDTSKALEFLETHFSAKVVKDESSVTGGRFLSVKLDGSDNFYLQVIESNIAEQISELKRSILAVDFIWECDNCYDFIQKIESAGLIIIRQLQISSYGTTAIFEDPFGNLWDVVQRNRD
jgi:uncharacterized glyoxalase superfamily protein PhnB